jgi:hypothetical protein
MKIKFMGLSKKIIVLLITLSLGFNTTLIVTAQPAELGAVLQETPEFSFNETELTSTQEETEKIPESTALPEIPEEPTKPEETTEPIVETAEPTEEITEPTEETTKSIIEETTEPEIMIKEPGSISGFIWGDGDGSLETDWDGFYNGYEQPIAGYNVYLYLAHDLSVPVDIAQSYEDGSYIFNNLEPGSYILGVASYIADNGGEYLLPFGITEDCKFAINWESDPLMAYTEPILLESGQIVQNVNAGMRLPAEPEMRVPEEPALRAAGKTIGQTIEGTNINGKVKIDQSEWYVVDKKEVYGVKYAKLMHSVKLYAPVFSPVVGTHNNKYEGSNMQKTITELLDPADGDYDTYFKTVYSMALVPYMNADSEDGTSSAIYTSKERVTEPLKFQPRLAKKEGIKKDVLFLPTYRDFTSWGTWIQDSKTWAAPMGHPLRTYGGKIWGRTQSSTSPLSYICGFNAAADAKCMDEGFYTQTEYYPNPGGSAILVWVWVQTSPGIQYTVTVHYVDTNGNSIKSSEKYEVEVTASFEHDAPVIDGYKYIYWKDSLTGAQKTTAVKVDNVIDDTDIYLVYEVDQSKTNVTITKTVTGAFADLKKDFTFMVSFKDGGGTQLMSGAFDYAGTGTVVPQGGQLTINDGKAVFTLKNGQEITIKDIPANYKIQIVETPVSGYEATFTDSDPTGSSGTFDTDYRTVGKIARTFSFTNKMNAPPPTSIDSGDMAIAITIISLVLLIITGSIAFRFAKKRTRIENK